MPAGVVAGEKVAHIDGTQPLDGLRDDALHDAAEMQAAHHGVDRHVGEQAAGLGADVDDAGMRAGAEHDESETRHVHDHHALVHQERIGRPLLRIVLAAELVLAALLERRHGGIPPL